MSDPEISIIVPTVLGVTFNKTIKSILKSIEGINIEVIVIVDNKHLNIEEYISPLYKIFHSPKNGVAAARNFGAQISTSNNLLFIDDDMLITKESIYHVLNFIVTQPDDCIIIEWDYPEDLYEKVKRTSFGRYLIKYGFTSMRGWSKEWNWFDNSLTEISSISSQFFYIKKSIFKKIKGYNEVFPFAGFEDYDFPVRMKQLGVKMYVDTTTLIYHNEEAKINLDSWMLRKFTGSYTRRIAVNLGYKELKIDSHIIKKFIYTINFPFYKFYIFIGNKLSDKLFFDFINHRYYNFLLGLSIYKGYCTKNL